MTTSPDIHNPASPFFIGTRKAVQDITLGESEENNSTEVAPIDPWKPLEATETLIEDSNAGEVAQAVLEAHGDVDPDSYEWHDIGTMKGGGVYIGDRPDEFVKGNGYQVAKRSSDGQLLLKQVGSNTVNEVRNILKKPYALSAQEAAGFMAEFTGYDGGGMYRKFAQSDHGRR